MADGKDGAVYTVVPDLERLEVDFRAAGLQAECESNVVYEYKVSWKIINID